jgi:hypothetical protein
MSASFLFCFWGGLKSRLLGVQQSANFSVLERAQSCQFSFLMLVNGGLNFYVAFQKEWSSEESISFLQNSREVWFNLLCLV